MADIAQFIKSNPIKAVEKYDETCLKLRYSSRISSDRVLDQITGDEERVRAIVLTKLVNQYGYPIERIQLECRYDMGRPKVTNPRADIIVRDEKGDAFMFIELKAPKGNQSTC